MHLMSVRVSWMWWERLHLVVVDERESWGSGLYTCLEKICLLVDSPWACDQNRVERISRRRSQKG